MCFHSQLFPKYITQPFARQPVQVCTFPLPPTPPPFLAEDVWRAKCRVLFRALKGLPHPIIKTFLIKYCCLVETICIPSAKLVFYQNSNLEKRNACVAFKFCCNCTALKCSSTNNKNILRTVFFPSFFIYSSIALRQCS